MTWSNEIQQALLRRSAGAPVWSYFQRRVRGHMEATQIAGARPLLGPLAGQALADALSRDGCRRRVIYIHVPFCQHICTFCAFFRRGSDSADMAGYLRSLRRQIDRYADSAWAQEGPAFEAVYFGGGTPTSLNACDLAGLVGRIRGLFPLSRRCEITVESRFEGVDEEYLRALGHAGVNRLSFGVQSFDTVVRRGIGRIVDRQRVLDLLAQASRLGFRNLNVDLIYNLPGQTLDSWDEDLKSLAQTPVTAASIYCLIPMRGSSLLRQIESGRAASLGDVAQEYAMSQLAHETLSRRPGWRRFGFQHFGRADCEANVYNRVRAGGMDTLGLGCGAGGSIDGLSYMNAMDLVRYAGDQESGADEHAAASIGSVSDLAEVYQLVEGDGIPARRLLDLLPAFAGTADRLATLGLLEESDGRLVLTSAGCFWGYNITAMLTEAIHEHMGPTSSDVPPPTVDAGKPACAGPYPLIRSQAC